MKKWVIGLIIVFLALGTYSIINYGPYATLDELRAYNNDDAKYLRAAETLINTGTLTYNHVDEPTVFIMPGIVLVLVPFVAIFGQEGAVLAFKIFQLLLQAFNLWLVYLIAKRIFNEKIAVITMLLSVFYIADFYALNTILTEICFKTLLLTLVLQTLNAFDKPSLKNYGLAGLIWAVTALFRPTISMYPIVVLIIWLVKRYRFTDILKYSIIVAGIFAICLSPWWIRNYNQFGRFIPLTESSGNPMIQGTYINYQENADEEAILDYSQAEIPNLEGLNTESQNNARETAIAKYRIKTLFSIKPMEYITWYTIGKTLHQWILPFVWRPIMHLNLVQIFAQHFVFVLLFIAGAIASIFNKNRNYKMLFIFLVMLYFNCVHLPFYAFSRYIFPVMPFALMFSAYSLAKIAQYSYQVIRFGKNKVVHSAKWRHRSPAQTYRQ